MSSRASLTLWEKDTSLALAGHPSIDGLTVKNTLWGRCITTSASLASHFFLMGWLKLNLDLLLDQLRLA